MFGDFNDSWKRHNKQIERMHRVMPWAIGIGALVSLGIVVTLGYVAYHFLMKIW